MKPKLEEERRKVVEAAREEALENAIALVKQKVREQLELEQQAKEDVGECSIVFFWYLLSCLTLFCFVMSLFPFINQYCEHCVSLNFYNFHCFSFLN